jgi:glutaminase
MNSCGMYNYAGQWSYEVGLPAKSGVAGGILAVIPGQIGIGVFSPRLDRHGHSVRGVQVCKAISETFGLHGFRNHTNSGAVVRRELRGDLVRSKHMRTPEARKQLDKVGRRICIVEVQGALFFGSTERLLRRVHDIAEEAEFIILDVRRVHEADDAARRMLVELLEWLTGEGRKLIFTHLHADGPLAALHALAARDDFAETVFERRDLALEWCENRLLPGGAQGDGLSTLALGKLEVFAGLNADELAVLERMVRPMVFDAGQAIVQEGDEARLFFVVASGSVTVQLRIGGSDSERILRVATLGPGVSFGEMALIDGGHRSADVVANERLICYGSSVEELHEIGLEMPKLLATILSNMLRDFSERLRRANDEVRALEE